MADDQREEDETPSPAEFPPHVVLSDQGLQCTTCGAVHSPSKYSRARDIRAFLELHAHRD